MQKSVLLILALFYIQISFSQIQSGKVIYRIKDYDIDVFKGPNDDIEKIKKDDSYRNSVIIVPKVEMPLYFNSEASFMEVAEQMSLSNGNNTSFNNVMTMAGSLGVYYNNIKEGVFLHKIDGNLVDYSNSELMEWEIHDETKVILGYTCIKATTNLINALFNVPVTAWFTPELPFPYGPQMINGLPGLILEMNFRKIYNYYADSIELSPEPLHIKKPKQGRKISWKTDYINKLQTSLDFTNRFGIDDEMTRRDNKLLEKIKQLE